MKREDSNLNYGELATASYSIIGAEDILELVKQLDEDIAPNIASMIVEDIKTVNEPGGISLDRNILEELRVKDALMELAFSRIREARIVYDTIVKIPTENEKLIQTLMALRPDDDSAGLVEFQKMEDAKSNQAKNKFHKETADSFTCLNIYSKYLKRE